MDTDSAEFERIVDANRRRLLGIARSYAKGTDVEDLYQDILLQIWRSLPSFSGRASIATWVYRVAVNTAIAYRRGAQPPATRAEAVPEATSRVAMPSGRNELEILAEFIETLGVVDRAVFLLYLNDLSYLEISEVTGLTESHVGVRIHRIKRDFIRRYIEE